MKDRNAWNDNKIERGIDPTLVMTERAFGVVHGAHPHLVPANPQFKGVSEQEARGLIENNYPLEPLAPSKPACQATTKKGLPCKAAPIAGEPFCVGHMRANDVRTN